MPSVLIVEDDLTIADLLQEVLEADGYTVTGIARTVKEALESANQYRPDLAIIDIRLANGDLGTTVGAHLRATTDVKIMFSTGNSNNVELMETCGDAVMTKPYSLNDVTRGLRIIEQLGLSGQTPIAFPRNFLLLEHVAVPESV